MRTKNILFFGFAAALLTGCTALPLSDVPAGTGSVAPVPVARHASSFPVPGSGALLERLTENGLLEKGAENAPLNLLLFTNHSCTYCQTFNATHSPRLQQEFIDRGLVKYQVATLPLQKYPSSELEASALLCAAKQQKGFAMHDLLFRLEKRDRNDVMGAANLLELDAKIFGDCLDSLGTKLLLEKQQQIASDLGITLVPTLILNTFDKLGADSEKFSGLLPYADLRGWINETLSK